MYALSIHIQFTEEQKEAFARKNERDNGKSQGKANITTTDFDELMDIEFDEQFSSNSQTASSFFEDKDLSQMSSASTIPDAPTGTVTKSYRICITVNFVFQQKKKKKIVSFFIIVELYNHYNYLNL